MKQAISRQTFAYDIDQKLSSSSHRKNFVREHNVSWCA